MGLELDKATVISTSVEGILYGFSVFMYAVTVWVLVSRRSAQTVNRPMIGVATLLFVFSTMHVATDIHRVILGVIDNRDWPEGGPAAWFQDTSRFTWIFKVFVMIATNVVSDAIIVYRCYKVWRSVKVILFPLILLCGLATAGIVATVENLLQGNVFELLTKKWITVYFSMSLATNSICTALLLFGIWRINKRASHSSGPTLKPILLIIIDAAVLYLAVVLAGLITFVRESVGQYVILDMIGPIAAITFYMVIIRVGMRNGGPFTPATSAVAQESTLRSSRTPRYTLRPPVEMRITQFVEVVHDENSSIQRESMIKLESRESV